MSKEEIRKLFVIVTGDKFFELKAKGGRVGYKSGMRVCKLAKKGKGKAYGKNS